ncbi:cob(I)yrinic acid a,c-diamide adenosyltransferase [Anoxybacterium hadale]|uniref:Cob(I)yrinic acid a,c-diamide adenosyltransferase n=1 Tax=Anoxybacterium hadale TaxID=3408580 RepID=A0ACD1ABN6_9FIRM|nr:cob(I)yrinic acid a,c-diamide adenosyltransferase [Clostridiales bacterium]
MDENRGLIHLYYGDGKGKTTAALGLAARAAGSGMRVVILQFLKNQETGELAVLRSIPGIIVLRGKDGAGFSFTMTEEEKIKTREIHDENLALVRELAEKGDCDLLILDEAIGACARNLLDSKQLEHFIRNKPHQMEVVLTGRKPAQWMLDCADYASEIRKIKHPFDKGIPARRGIEK